jgi:hypothetical protein
LDVAVAIRSSLARTSVMTVVACALAFAACGSSPEPARAAPAGAEDFGWSAALSGSTAVVGTVRHSGTGAAYVFVRSKGRWYWQAKLTASGHAAPAFGFSVAVWGSTAVVGAPFTKSGTGAAYVFVRSRGGWSRQAELTASGHASGGGFGFSVALSGSTLVVGAPATNSDTGAAYVFVRSKGRWYRQARLTASDATTGGFFGNAVALSGPTAVVGAENTNSEAGAAYVFARSGTGWSQQAEFKGRHHGQLLGDSVAVSGSTAVIGVEGSNSLTGAAYVFARSGSKWTRQATLTASDHAATDQFGGSVAVSGSAAVVGAFRKNNFTGAAYVFVRSGGKWSQQAKLTAPDHATGDAFGAAVAIYGPTALAGAYRENARTGAAYVFARSRGKWSQQAKLTP